MAANAVFIWRVFVRKNMVYWPVAVIPVAYYFISSQYKYYLYVDCCKNTVKNYLTCATWANNIILGKKETKYWGNATKFLMFKTFDVNLNKYSQSQHFII